MCILFVFFFLWWKNEKQKSQHNTWLCSRNWSKTTKNKTNDEKKIALANEAVFFRGNLFVQTFFPTVKRKYNKINVGKAQYITICCISQSNISQLENRTLLCCSYICSFSKFVCPCGSVKLYAMCFFFLLCCCLCHSALPGPASCVLFFSFVHCYAE